MTKHFERNHPDMQALHEGLQKDAYFICEVVGRSAPAHVVFENEHAVAFLDKYPRQYGYTLVAPKKHLEQVTSDFSLEGYLELQTLVYTVSEAIREEVGAERMYIFAFGSNQGNAHVHWHVVPLPPGAPYTEQQGAAVSWALGVLKLPEDEMVALATRLGKRVRQFTARDG